MAQLGARLHGMQKVEGSSPSGSMRDEDLAHAGPFLGIRIMAKSRIIIQEFSNVTVVTFQDSALLQGEVIDRVTADLYELIDSLAKRKLVLDFANVRMLASQMLGTLISLNQKSKAIKGELVLCGMRDELKSVFKITNLDKSFTFCPDHSSALAHFRVYV